MVCTCIGYNSAEAVKHLLCIVEKCLPIVPPVCIQILRVKLFCVRPFHSDFPAVMVVVHIVLSSALRIVPVATFGNSSRIVCVVIHSAWTFKVIRIDGVAGICILMAYIFPPVCIGVRMVRRIPVLFVPRIIQAFGATVSVCRHYEIVSICVVFHHCNFRVACASVSVEVREATVKVGAVGVCTAGTSHTCAIARTVECSVGVGVWRNVYLDIVHKVCNLLVSAIFCQKFVNKTNHEIPASGFVAVHCAAPPEFWLVFVNAHIVRNNHRYNRASIYRIAYSIHLA